MGGNIPGENFLGSNYSGGGFSRREFGGWEFFGREFHRGGFPRTIFACNVSILIFQKIIIKYDETFNKNIYTLNT